MVSHDNPIAVTVIVNLYFKNLASGIIVNYHTTKNFELFFPNFPVIELSF